MGDTLLNTNFIHGHLETWVKFGGPGKLLNLYFQLCLATFRMLCIWSLNLDLSGQLSIMKA